MEHGQKFDQGKPMMELLPPLPLLGIAEGFTYGAQKYAPRNWERGIAYGRLYGALQRHLAAWWAGQERDPESGLSHLDHAGCCLLMLHDMRRLHPELDDRPQGQT